MAMTSLHAAVGIAIVKVIPNPLISLPLALLSHLLVDLYPEYWSDKPGPVTDLKKYDWKEKTLGIVQLILLIGIGAFLFKFGSIWMLLGAFLANLPDLWDFISEKLTGKNMWYCHMGGFLPLWFKRTHPWQNAKMRAIQNAVVDAILVTMLLLLCI